MSEDTEHDGGPAEWWDEVYDSDDPAPWDTGEPQSAFVDLAAEGKLDGRVLDIGCGTGTHACWAVERGHPATGTDISERGIECAREKADERGLDATFRVTDALDMPDDLGPFDTVLDSGLFHALETDQRKAYADELAGLVSAGGQVWLVGFREGAPEDWGPNPFARADVRGAFAGAEWTAREMRDVEFETREAAVQALLAVVERV